MFIDSHAHLTVDGVYEEIEEILERARASGVEQMVNICIDEPSLTRGLELVSKHPHVHQVAATTPHDVDKEGQSFFPLVEKAAREGKLVAIGETGLDYYYEHSKKQTQQEYLRKYLQLALAVKLPVVIHCRDAFADFFDILDEEYQVDGVHEKGVLHCFTGTLDEAHEVIKRGWYLSLSGIVTFKKSEELREVAKIVPLDKLLIETDTPYLAPRSKRGKRNEPAYLPETAQVIAEARGVDVGSIAKATKDNACALFGFHPNR